MLGELTDISILIIYCSHVKFVLCLASSLNKLGVYCPLYYVALKSPSNIIFSLGMADVFSESFKK